MSKYDVPVEIDLSGPDGNAFAVLAIVARALKAAGAPSDEINKYRNEATSGTWTELIATTGKWVNFTDLSDDDE
jgi:hypothetical protein